MILIYFLLKRKNPLGFHCVILILNLSRLISLITILISKVCRVWFPKFIAFDFSNDTFGFQNLLRLIFQMTLLISKIYRNLFLKWHFWCPKFDTFDFSNDTFDFQNFASLPAGGSPLVWWVYTWPFALLFSARVWLPCQAKEFVKMLYVLLWNLVTIMYVYCSMFYVSFFW